MNYNLMGLASYMWSVVGRNVVMRRIPVQISWALQNLRVVMLCAVWGSAGSLVVGYFNACITWTFPCCFIWVRNLVCHI